MCDQAATMVLSGMASIGHPSPNNGSSGEQSMFTMRREGIPTVHLLCGLNGAGKTTYAVRLAEARGAVRFSLDEWLLMIHPEIRYDAGILLSLGLHHLHDIRA